MISRLKKQSGVGLIEVMLAILILSIGFLAAAKMQVEGMRYSQSAYFLSQANLMLRDMTDRMRANRQGVLDGHYNSATTAAGTSSPACVSAGNKCTPAQIALNDIHSWSNYLHAPANAVDFIPLLPSSDNTQAQGSITLDATTGVYDITVQWSDLNIDTQETRTLSVQLTP